MERAIQIDAASGARYSYRISLVGDRPDARIRGAARFAKVPTFRVSRSSGHQTRHAAFPSREAQGANRLLGVQPAQPVQPEGRAERYRQHAVRRAFQRCGPDLSRKIHSGFLIMMTSALILMLLTARQENLEIDLPNVDQVISAMERKDAERRSQTEGYTGTRTYVLENEAHNKRAEMTVRITCQPDGTKQFEVLSSTGWGGARKHVFPRLLDAEASASGPRSADDSRVTAENYSFRMLGTEEIDGRTAYAIEVTPKLPKKYLMRGTIWVDASDYAIVRMQGSPAKNPSFFIKSVTFTHNRSEEHT